MILRFKLLLVLFSFNTVCSQTNWQKFENNPVIQPRKSAGVFAHTDPSLLYDGSLFHLWISGGGFIPGDTLAGVRTYYFTSEDGYQWTYNPANPVFREAIAGAWDSGHIETPHVIKNGDEYWLYYVATVDTAADDPATLQLGLAKSPDGENWARHSGNPLMGRGEPESWEARWIESPCVVKTDSLFYMWYNGFNPNWRIHVGLAISEDGIHWEKSGANPVFSPQPGSDWDSVGVYAPQVRWLDDRFLMFYTGIVFNETGYDFQNTRTGVASSPDGIHWQRLSDQPLLTGTFGAWDATGPFTLDWAPLDDELFMLYTSNQNVGAATASFTGTKVEFADVAKPNTSVLFQNYPNPFNNETVISYRLLNRGEVHIEIYDILGKLIRTFSTPNQKAGAHQVYWDGTDFYRNPVASGIYLYHLKTRDENFVKRMVLLR